MIPDSADISWLCIPLYNYKFFAKTLVIAMTVNHPRFKTLLIKYKGIKQWIKVKNNQIETLKNTDKI
jgi:hypothetical protein